MGIVLFYSSTTSSRAANANWTWIGDAYYSWYNNTGDRNKPKYTNDSSNMNLGTRFSGVFQTAADVKSSTQWRIACALHYNYKHG